MVDVEGSETACDGQDSQQQQLMAEVHADLQTLLTHTHTHTHTQKEYSYRFYGRCRVLQRKRYSCLSARDRQLRAAPRSRAHLARLVVDDGVEEGEDCDLEVGRVLRLVQTPSQVHYQRLQKATLTHTHAHTDHPRVDL